MRDRVILVLAGSLVALLLAEFTLIAAAPQVHRLPEVWAPDPQLGWWHRPGAEGRLVTPEFDVGYRIDADGLRQHPPLAAGSDAGPVQVYGDSFAEGWGVEVEQTVAARLEARLATAGAPCRVENFGVAGYGTDQELLLFQARGAARRPATVVCLFYANDLWNNASRHGIGAQRGAKPYFRLGSAGQLDLQGVPVAEPPPRPAGAALWLAERWHLWALVRRAGQQTAELPPQSLRHFYGGLYGPQGGAGAQYAGLWDLSERLVARFAERAAEQGARFVLSYAPAIVQVEAEDWRTKRELHDLAGDYDLGKPSRLLAAAAARHGLEFVDLQPSFVAAAAAGEDLYYDESHWRPAAHDLAARLLLEALLAQPVESGADGRG